MAKLNQILAVSKTVKRNAQVALTKAYHELPKADPLTGVSRVYRPRDEEGEKLPPEYKKVVTRAQDVVDQIHHTLAKMFETVGTIDLTNMEARADLIVDGTVLMENVPATHLLWLEKQLADVRSFIAVLPTLDPKSVWQFNTAEGIWETEPRITVRSKKIPRNHVKAEATEKHPAQVEIWYEDVTVGYWETRDLSGALQPSRVAVLLERVDMLLRQVKQAREQANMTEAATLESGALLDWLFRP